MRKQLLAVAILAMAATGAFAQPPAQGPGAMPPPGPCAGPDKQDLNKVQTREEFMARAAKHFDQLDANRDGKITPEERKAFSATRELEIREHAARCAGGLGPGPGAAPGPHGPQPRPDQSGPRPTSASASASSSASAVRSPR